MKSLRIVFLSLALALVASTALAAGRPEPGTWPGASLARSRPATAHPVLRTASGITWAAASPTFTGTGTVSVGGRTFTIGTDAFPTIQAAIDAVDAGGTVWVLPGTYNETAAGRYLYDGSGPYQFGIFVGADKPNLTVMGVDDDGVAVTSADDVVCTIDTNPTNSFGTSGFFVEGDHTTFTGLGVGTSALPYANKSIEVIGNDFTLLNSVVADAEGSVYINDWRCEAGTSTAHVESYRIEGNQFHSGNSLDIASGPGWSGAVSGRRILNNSFQCVEGEYWPPISFSGTTPDVGWFVYPVGGAVITGNHFANTDTTGQHIRARGIYDNSQFDWTTYWDDNTFNKAACVGAVVPGTPRPYAYGVFTNVRRIGATLRGEVEHVVAGDVVLAKAGTYTEQVSITTNDVTLRGAGKASTILASPATLATSFGTKKAVLTVNGATGVTIRDLAVDGLGMGNANYQFVGVAFWNAGGALLDADVTRIEDAPFSGVQHGVAIYAYNSTGGPYGLEVGGVTVTDFQKNAMALNGTGLTVNVHDCVVTGAGQTTVTAQNGIQIGYGATGSITDCDVAGIYYTGPSWTASGLLLMPGSPVTVSGGSIAGCQTSIYFEDVAGSVSGTEITVPLAGGIGAWGIEVYNTQTTLAARAGASTGTDRVRPQAQPFADEPSGNSVTLGTAASLMTLALHGGCLTGPGVTGTEGIDIFSDGGGLSVTADGMEITGWEYGVGVGGAGSPTVDMTHNAIFGNLAYGFALYGSSGTCTAEYDWWGGAGGPGVGGANPAAGVDYTPWLIAGTDLTAGCGFGAPPENQIQPVAPSTCITPAHECVAVPVTIARTTGEGVRGYTVDVQLAGGLTLCGAGIAEGGYLNSISTTAYQVVDNGGGSYTVDCAILGTPCGAVAVSGTLFTLNVGGSGTGTGTVTLSAGELRDCDNATVLSSLGAPVSITVDHSAPAVITALAAAQVKTGNDGDGTTKINVSWPAVESEATVHVYRADFGHYPEYDDDGGAVPAVPTTYPPGTGWTLAGDVAGGTSLADEPPSRGFWYYVAYVEDPCGNVSAVSNRTGGTLDYHLGDVMAGATVCGGNNVVDIGDISLLGGHYGVAAGGSLYLACLDVGPTTNRSVDARPTTDNRINFEDMMMFAINYGTVSVTTAPLTPVAAVASDVLWVDGPAKVTAGQTFTASLRLSGSGTLLGLSAALGWDHAIAEIVGVEAGEMVTAQGGLVLSPGEGVVDCALLGADRRLSGDGELARVTFRALASGAPSLAVATVDARDAANRTLTLTGTVPTSPTRTSFAPAVPNPFRGTTTLSYALARGGAVELAVYGVDGRRVATLASGVQEAGSYRLTWDGGNARPGLYYARLSTPEGRFTRTLVLVK